jgi:hypothetical protein
MPGVQPVESGAVGSVALRLASTSAVRSSSAFLATGFFAAGGAGGRFFRCFFVLFFFVVFFLVVEVGIAPDGIAQGCFADGVGVEDDIMPVGLEAGAAEVGAGGLQGVEEEAGGFGVDLSGNDQAHDLHEGDLDGVGVLEDGEIDGGGAAAGRFQAGVVCSIIFKSIEIELDALVVVALVEVAELVAAKGGTSALRAVDLDVLTAIGKRWHGEFSLTKAVSFWFLALGSTAKSSTGSYVGFSIAFDYPPLPFLHPDPLESRGWRDFAN